MIKNTIVTAIIFLIFASEANAKISVDLSYYFKTDKPPIQIGGSCHVYSAVSLVEAACYKAIQKHIDISETYQFYMHLRAKLETCTTLDGIAKRTGCITPVDGGDPGWTIERILNNSVCASSEFQGGEGLFDGLQNVLTKINNNTVKSACDFLDCEAGKRLNNTSNPETKNAALKECLTHPMNLKKEYFSEERALELLKEKTPFICVGYFLNDKNENIPHSVVVAGFREGKGKTREFLVRDSSTGSVYYRALPCEGIYSIQSSF